ncbi:hypothetical protein KBT42_000868 [Salmonella enterica]|nr:hypothetical protein [Salmonella enterica]EHJ6297325.1 hypothetical protein [Salmonella enterica]
MRRHTVELTASSTAARERSATATDGNYHDFRYGWAIAGKEAHQQAQGDTAVTGTVTGGV